MELNITEILLSMVNFVIVVLVLRFLLFKPVLKVIDKRQAQIQADLDEAAAQKQEAAHILDEARVSAQTLQADAERQMDEAVHLAELKQDEMLKEARRSSQAMIAKAEEDIRILRKRSLRKEQHAISDMSVQLASKLMKQSLDKDEHEALIDQFMTEVGALSDGTRGK